MQKKYLKINNSIVNSSIQSIRKTSLLSLLILSRVQKYYPTLSHAVRVKFLTLNLNLCKLFSSFLQTTILHLKL